MLAVILTFFRSLLSGWQCRSWFVLEYLTLRHQLAVLNR